MTNEVTKKGVVKWFDKAKGFGFIVPESGGADVFVHYKDINGEEGEYKTLLDAQHVEYEESSGDRGLKAKNVTVVPKEG